MDVILANIPKWGFIPAMWVFFILFVIHELEEWNIAHFESQFFWGLPENHSDRNARAWIAVISIFYFLLALASTLINGGAWAGFIFFPAIVICVTNSVQHLYWSIRFKKVAPGVITSTVLLLPGSSVLLGILLGEGTVPLWFMAALSIPGLIALVNTVRAGDKAPGIVPFFYRTGAWAADLVGRAHHG